MKLLHPLLTLLLASCTFVTEDDWSSFDADGDGYTVNAEGQGEDCDDHDPAIHPDAAESCNGIDDDCDGAVDDGVLTTFFVDADADGWGNADFSLDACTAPSGYVADNTDGVAFDCDDGEALSYPQAPELCDDQDNDCDGTTDEPDDIAWLDWYRDSDADGYGDPDDVLNDCAQPDGFVADSTDCDDGDDAIHPGAEELCDHIDNDCDGLTDLNDPGLIGDWTWHQDADGDGHGDPATAVGRCEQPTGYVLADDDCDDSRGTIHPDAIELCGGLDDDCDGLVDEADPDLQGTATFYLDGDDDGYGLTSGTASGCTAPLGYAALSGDCNDSDTAYHPGASETDCHDPADYNCDGSTGYADLDGDGWVACEECDDGDTAAYPGATELCDGRDNDCDGTVDEDDADDAPTWYADADSDGFGDPAASARACSVPTGFVSDDTDCDDARSATHPGALEWCNGHDDNCDGTTDEDEAIDAPAWYADADNDGYGVDTSTDVSCEAPDGFAALPGDCDDADSAYNPGATEDDCGDLTDYNCDGATGYTDADGDGWAACEECDDSDARINPGATEVCDGVDDDCDGTVDESDAEDALTWYADADGDGYGDLAEATDACSAPTGTVPGASDCDDTDADSHPGALEYCDGHDDDCDGITDEDDSADAPTWYGDADGDGYGEPTTTTLACEVHSGFAVADTDCDDGATATYPGATEYCDGVDTDCDGTVDEDDALDATTWYADMDGDAYGDPDATLVSCLAPPSFVTDSTDCDDGAPAVNPAATELCDGVDDDCDGTVDEDDAADAPTWYADVDGDGYGDTATGVPACSQPSAHELIDGDCDDAEPSTNPDALEYCNGHDDDCDGVTDEDEALDVLTWYADVDLDGYGDAGSPDIDCDQPTGFVADSSDCDDGDGVVHPGADEYCDGVDSDCDGELDEADALDAVSWYVDADGDGYGDPGSGATACYEDSGLSADDTDCDDGDAEVYPGADELWNGVDDDCDGMSDVPSSLVVGPYNSAVVMEDGSAWAWGLNNDDLLLCGATGNAATPVEVGCVSGIEDLSFGSFHALALLDNGSVWAWGSNSYGQLGDGTETESSTAVEVSLPSDAVAIAAGHWYSLAVLDDGTLWSWGSNSHGVLGDGSETNSSVPVEVSGLSGVELVEAGGYHSLAVLDDGSLWAWGYNSRGQLGDGTDTASSTPLEVPLATTVGDVAAGDFHSAALLDDGSLWAWGNNGTGQLGNGGYTDSLSPVEVTGLTGLVAIKAGGNHTLALVDNGTLWAWGYNEYGQVGDGTEENQYSPALVTDLSGVMAVTAGANHSLAMLDDGTLMTWGQDSSGQLGDGWSGTGSVTPVAIDALEDVVELSAGSYFSTALDSDGVLWAWGDNSRGQLSDGTSTDSSTPISIDSLGVVVQAWAGGDSHYAVDSGGAVWHMGSAGYGQRGDGTTGSYTTPLEVADLVGMDAIACGSRHTLGIATDGTAWAWGDNENGQLGDGTFTDSLTPTEVSGLSGVEAVSAGFFHSLALLDDGSVWAWGRNTSGELADGSVSQSDVPLEVSGLVDIVAIAAGGGFSLALESDGTLWTWGSNDSGQLGTGSSDTSSAVPQAVGLAGVEAIGAGGSHVLALLTDGTVWAWGNNFYGQLGDGTFTESGTPVQVLDLTAVLSIATGGYHSLALLEDGTIYGWGDSSYGQLGFDSWSPQPVAYPE